MYFYAVYQFKDARKFVRRVPSVSEKMLGNVEQSLASKGTIAMIVGPIRGIPYKAFAIFAPKAGINYISFFLSSFPAHFTRFFLTFIISWLLADVLFNNIFILSNFLLFAIIFLFFYIMYFFFVSFNFI